MISNAITLAASDSSSESSTMLESKLVHHFCLLLFIYSFLVICHIFPHTARVQWPLLLLGRLFDGSGHWQAFITLVMIYILGFTWFQHWFIFSFFTVHRHSYELQNQTVRERCSYLLSHVTAWQESLGEEVLSPRFLRTSWDSRVSFDVVQIVAPTTSIDPKSIPNVEMMILYSEQKKPMKPRKASTC